MDTLNYMEGYGILRDEALSQRHELEELRARVRDMELVNHYLANEWDREARRRREAEASEAAAMERVTRLLDLLDMEQGVRREAERRAAQAEARLSGLHLRLVAA